MFNLFQKVKYYDSRCQGHGLLPISAKNTASIKKATMYFVFGLTKWFDLWSVIDQTHKSYDKITDKVGGEVFNNVAIKI